MTRLFRELDVAIERGRRRGQAIAVFAVMAFAAVLVKFIAVFFNGWAIPS